jgi:hypothetical protein
MTKIIAEDKARRRRWGRHGLRILIAALLLAFIASGAAEIYGEMTGTSPTTRQDSVPKG